MKSGVLDWGGIYVLAPICRVWVLSIHDVHLAARAGWFWALVVQHPDRDEAQHAVVDHVVGPEVLHAPNPREGRCPVLRPSRPSVRRCDPHGATWSKAVTEKRPIVWVKAPVT